LSPCVIFSPQLVIGEHHAFCFNTRGSDSGHARLFRSRWKQGSHAIRREHWYLTVLAAAKERNRPTSEDESSFTPQTSLAKTSVLTRRHRLTSWMTVAIKSTSVNAKSTIMKTVVVVPASSRSFFSCFVLRSVTTKMVHTPQNMMIASSTQ